MFRHPNDYVTYAWVQDNEISSGKDVKQVRSKQPGNVLLLCANVFILNAVVEWLLALLPSSQVYLSAEELPASGGEFLLGYYSHMMQSIVGLSQPFKVG